MSDGFDLETGRAPAARVRQTAVFLAAFLQLMGLGVMVTVLPFYGIALHGSALQVTLLFSASALGTAVSEPLWGRLSDRWGRRSVLAASLLLSAAAAASLALCATPEAAILSRFLFGLAAGNISTFQALVLDTSSPGEKATRIGFLGAAFSLAFVVGPLIGGALSHASLGRPGFYAPIAVAGLLSAISALVVLLFIPSSKPRRGLPGGKSEPQLAWVSAPGVGLIIAATAVAISAFAGLDALLGLWTNHRYGWGPAQLGECFMLFGIVSALAQGVVAARLGRRIGVAAVLRLGALMTGTGLVAAAFAADARIAVAALLVVIAGEGLVQPSLPILLARALPNAEHEGAALGVNMAVAALSRIIAPTLSGAIYARLGATAALAACSIFSFATAFLTLRIASGAKVFSTRL